MKILSWNVNGLNACISKGFLSKITEFKADVICLQETKINEIPELSVPYHTYWSFAEKNGYSGTAVFSRYTPLNVSYGIGDEIYDSEGRVITLEFQHYFLVNVYVPNSQSNLKRMDYRNGFDVAFRNYIGNLLRQRPVILCGDFNVPHREIDIYPENPANERLSKGFEPQERTSFSSLLELGLIDVFRYRNPEAVEYTWWSQRLNKRFENKGWRLDYFLASSSLAPYITRFAHMLEIYGSDHCPIMMEINQHMMKVDDMTNEELTRLWEEVDWYATQQTLLQMQQKLSKAAYAKDGDRIAALQKRIVRSDAAKLLAVRHVAETSSGPGIDGVKWTTSADKQRASMSLTSKDYKAQPCRHIVIQSKNSTKERHVSIPTMYDRAMQVLYAYSLDPVAEATAERKSFAFRKGRSLQDVHAYLMSCLNSTPMPKFVLIADVQSCYHSISHDWLLENIPMDKYVLREFLKSGYIFAGSLFPTEQGISLGANISPILGNMTLDGLQKFLFDSFYGDGPVNYGNGNLIRFADDIIVTADDRASAERFREIIADFLRPRGLCLSSTKTHICDLHEGFDFLSRHYSNKNGIVYATPSETAVSRFEGKIKLLIEEHKGSQQSLIEALNRKLIGFASYHRSTEAELAFRHIDVTVNALLLDLCKRKHPQTSREKLIGKYWYRLKNDVFVYALPNKAECQVVRLSDVCLTTHKKVKTNANPYLETEYFAERSEEREISNMSGKYKAIWKRQSGKCYYCGLPILPDQSKTIVAKDITKKKTVDNMVYVHSICQEDDFIQCRIPAEHELMTGEQVIALLRDLHEDKPVKKEYQPFELLREYFFNLELSPHTLSFAEIEKIMGISLCNSARKYTGYWYNKNHGGISDCWRNNGYVIQNLHMDKEYIVFRKDNTSISKLVIPKVFLARKIPSDAKYEIESFLEHIRKKYGL